MPEITIYEYRQLLLVKSNIGLSRKCASVFAVAVTVTVKRFARLIKKQGLKFRVLRPYPRHYPAPLYF